MSTATLSPEIRAERRREKNRRQKANRTIRRALRPRPHREDGPNDCLWRPELRASELYREAAELWDSHRYRAAGMLARAAIENKLREIARKSPRVYASPNAQIVNCVYTLHASGVIDAATKELLLTVANIANRAAHGGDVTLEQIGMLLRVGHTIVYLWPVDAQPMVALEPEELACV